MHQQIRFEDLVRDHLTSGNVLSRCYQCIHSAEADDIICLLVRIEVKNSMIPANFFSGGSSRNITASFKNFNFPLIFQFLLVHVFFFLLTFTLMIPMCILSH